MTRCSYCDSRIFLGGVKNRHLTFCNQTCHRNGLALFATQAVPDSVINDLVQQVHSGPCPKCRREGLPIDVHTSHFIWSALILTSWSSKPTISCRPCGVKTQISDTVASGLVGWWGFPWGLVITPIQLYRNIAALLATQHSGPSPQLRKLVSITLAANLLAQQNAKPTQPPPIPPPLPS